MDVCQIKQGLQQPGKTRAGLAKRLGVDVSQVSRLLCGKRHLKVYEVPLIRDYLYGDCESAENKTGLCGSAVEASPQDSLSALFAIRELLDEADSYNIDVADTIAMALRSAIRECQAVKQTTHASETLRESAQEMGRRSEWR